MQTFYYAHPASRIPRYNAGMMRIGEYARRFTQGMSYFPRTARMVWQAARMWFAGWLALLLLQGLLPLATVYFTRQLAESLLPPTGASIRPALLWAAAVAATLLAGEALGVLTQWVRGSQAEALNDAIGDRIHRKSIEVDLAFYEAPEFYDRLHRAREEAAYRPIGLIESLGSLLQSTVTFLAMIAVLAAYGLWVPAALVAGTLPGLAILLRYTALNQELIRKQTAEQRRAWYYDSLLTTREPAAEIRLFQTGDHFREAFNALRRKLRSEKLALLRQQSAAEITAAILAYSVHGAALLWMVWKTADGRFSAAQLLVFFQAFFYGQRLLRSSLDNVGTLYANTLFLGNLYEFLELKPAVVSPSPALTAPVLKRELLFRSVTFRYPGSEKPALENFSLMVPAGVTTAIMGPNGAGKSTLLKLACRFYDPEAGVIEWDGADLRKLQLEELRQRITVLFQEPVHYSGTVAENITMGDVGAPPEEERVRRALRDAGAVPIAASLSLQERTLLGKAFENGAELSVGEWQRLCLARAFYRRAPLLLLDEPTSAMDSWAENEWMRHFRELAAGRTVLLITHRITTAMRADTIHVMQHGRIVESGSHEQLVARGGLYAQSWTERDTKAKADS